MNTWEFATLDDIATHLKTDMEVIKLIQSGHIFPKGKQCVLNKYSIKPLKPRPEDDPKKKGIIEFN
jgi:hypothetical protein